MDDLLESKDLRAEGVPYSRNRLADLIKVKRFPAPFRFSPDGRRYWERSTIRAHVAALKAAAHQADDKAA
jgi:hypothetical protein